MLRRSEYKLDIIIIVIIIMIIIGKHTSAQRFNRSHIKVLLKAHTQHDSPRREPIRSIVENGVELVHTIMNNDPTWHIHKTQVSQER